MVLAAMLLAAILLAAILLSAATWQSSPPPLQVTYLANMGVLLEVGNRRIVIDGFHHAELDGTPDVPPELLRPLESATGDMRGIDAALTTHRHLDHFAWRSVAARLVADQRIHYLAPAEVIDTLRAHGMLPSAHRVHAFTPPTAGRTELDLDGIRVSVLDLPHNPTRTPRAQNVGYLIRVNGLTILHVGDADPTAERYAPHKLPAERIDVAILPTWYLTGSSEMVRRHIAPRRVLASHVWEGDTTKIKRDVQREWPNAVVLVRPGERVRVAR